MVAITKADKTPVGPAATAPEKPPLVTLEMLQQVVKLSPFTNWSGTEVTDVRHGYAEAKTPFRKDLTQHHGFLHGGIIGFLSDNVSAWAAATVVGDVLTADYSVKLLAPGKGDYFVARASVVKATRRLVAVESKVYAVTLEDGEPTEKLIAMGTATVLPAALPTARQ
ncbi:MAG: PaaI family thioesterase [Kordiimonadaceae bacterium]|nr:PaaI family thioesterase [Kordiimonadaceae bacterium]